MSHTTISLNGSFSANPPSTLVIYSSGSDAPMMPGSKSRLSFEVKIAAILPALALFFGLIGQFGVSGSAIATALFYASLLLHESAHLLLARLTDTPVSGMGLCLWGAYIRRKRAHAAAAEIAISAAGPAMNLLLAVLFWNSYGLLLWMAHMNVVLLAINVLPIANSDGQRILRTAISRRKPANASQTETDLDSKPAAA